MKVVDVIETPKWLADGDCAGVTRLGASVEVCDDVENWVPSLMFDVAVRIKS